MVASIQAVVVLCLYQLVKSHRVCPRSLSVPPIGREGLVFQAGTVSSGPSCEFLVSSVPVVLGLINHGCPIPETLAAQHSCFACSRATSLPDYPNVPNCVGCEYWQTATVSVYVSIAAYWQNWP